MPRRRGPGAGPDRRAHGRARQGKSHILAAIFHALSNPAAAKAWLQQWAQHLGNPHLSGIAMREGFRVIAEPLHNHRYATLWDLLFDRTGKKVIICAENSSRPGHQCRRET